MGESIASALGVAEEAVRQASQVILAIAGTARVWRKPDSSSVTEGDLAADRTIRAIIGEAFPDDAILTEEGADDPGRLSARRCWIVDPIDGTSAFIRGHDDYDVYVALVVDGEPVVAVTAQPATGLLLRATLGGGAWLSRNGCAFEPLRYLPVTGHPVIGTRPWLGGSVNLPRLKEVAATLGDGATARAVRFGLNVRSFLPPRRVDAMAGVPDGHQLEIWEWDVAPVDLIVREAGGAATDLAGNRLRFNKPHPAFPDGLLFSADPSLHDRILQALERS